MIHSKFHFRQVPGWSKDLAKVFNPSLKRSIRGKEKPRSHQMVIHDEETYNAGLVPDKNLKKV